MGQNQRPFLFHKKSTAAIWSVNKIIPVSIALIITAAIADAVSLMIAFFDPP